MLKVSIFCAFPVLMFTPAVSAFFPVLVVSVPAAVIVFELFCFFGLLPSALLRKGILLL